MSYHIQEINHRIQADPKEFVDACDAAYAEKIERAARAIAENVHTCPIVLLSGPSGSGKTTTAMKIAEALRKMGIGSQSLAMDDYFRTVNPRTAPRTPEGDIDLESPACLDMDLLGTHLNALARNADGRRRLVEKIDRLVGQMPRRQITPRLVDRRHYGLVRNGNPVMDFVDLLDAAQH